jgi:hypothetical protein
MLVANNPDGVLGATVLPSDVRRVGTAISRSSPATYNEIMA